MKMIKKVIGAVVFSSFFGCGKPPDFAKNLNDDQKEEVELAIRDIEAMMPTVEASWKKARPLFDANGRPVEDNEILISDTFGVLDDLHFYFDNNQIYAVNSADLEADGFEYSEASGRFIDTALEQSNRNNDFILLNEDHNWSGELLMHEASHRTDAHDEGVVEYLLDQGWEYDRSLGKWLVNSGDWAMLQTTGFGFIERSLDDLFMVRESIRRNQDDPEAFLENWENFISMTKYFFEIDEAEWRERFFEDLTQNNPDSEGFFEEIGLSFDELEEIMKNSDLFVYRCSELKKRVRIRKGVIL